MSFASFSYVLLFLPFTVLLAIGASKLVGARAAQAWVLAASIVFYAQARPFNLIYLSGSVLTNWLISRWIERAEQPARKRLLVLGLGFDILFLCTFKYVGFFAGMVPFALPGGYSLATIAAPLGVSFFTITQIMYLVDCYEGITTAGTLFDHASFVCFFPYLISGPLGRVKRMRHQFDRFGGVDGDRTQSLARGVFHFSMGMFKKIVLADSFARVASFGFNSATHVSALEGWVFGVVYTLQIYFDFSGYSDMAIGSAMMLGIEIPRNFDSPLKAASIIDFWQRWHISLTGFITTYLYTPIIRSIKKRTLLASSLATVVAMCIAGLWHGAAWTFVVFGMLHGVGLAVNQVWRKKKLPRLPVFLSWLLTFSLVVIAFVYFGSSSLADATQRVIGMFNPHSALDMTNLGRMSIEGVSFRIFWIPWTIGAFAAFVGPSSEQLARDFRPSGLTCAATVALTLTAIVFLNSAIPPPFVYFRF